MIIDHPYNNKEPFKKCALEQCLPICILYVLE